MSWVGFAAITLDSTGGGVAAASRLMWRACRSRWNGRCRLVSLARGGSDHSFGTLSQIRFGARLAAAQSVGDCGGVFYSHLSLARVQSFVPPSLRRPYAVFLHGIEAWAPLSHHQRRVLEGAALLIANSEYTARRVSGAHQWMPPIAACPLGLSGEVPIGRPAPAVPDIGHQAVLVVARMDSAERYKGHDQLLEVWPTIVEQVPAAKLLVVGGGDDLPRLQTKAADLGVGQSVVFTGFVPEPVLEALYDRAAVFAMPSRNEGFGLVYLEAMAHGVPCVGSVHDAAGDVIEDGTTGFLVDQGDSAALADRIVGLLSDRGLRHAMGAAGRRRLERQFSYEQFRSRLVSLIEEVFGCEA